MEGYIYHTLHDEQTMNTDYSGIGGAYVINEKGERVPEVEIQVEPKPVNLNKFVKPEPKPEPGKE
jgi:hypothetical protein